MLPYREGLLDVSMILNRGAVVQWRRGVRAGDRVVRLGTR